MKTGRYAMTGGSNCSNPGDNHTIPGGKVVVVGHGAGGVVVAGYPGQYHDVAAMIGPTSAPASPPRPHRAAALTRSRATSPHHLSPTVVLLKDLRDERRGPRATDVKVTPKQLHKFPLHFEVTGTLQLWSGMSPAQWCGGFVDVQVGATTEKPTTARTPVHKDCTFTEGIHVSGKPQAGKARFVRLRFRFDGNEALQQSAAKTFVYRLPSS